MVRNSKHTNPIEDEKLYNKFVAFVNKFNQFFENEVVDEIVNKEFAQEYALLQLRQCTRFGQREDEAGTETGE